MRVGLRTIAAGSALVLLPLASATPSAASAIDSVDAFEAIRGVGPVGTSLSASVDRKRLEYGEQVTLTSRLTENTADLPVADQTVILQARTGGTRGWSTLGQRTTGGQGKATWSKRLAATTDLRVLHPADASYARSVSPDRSIQVTPTLSARVNKPWVRQAGRATFHGRVKPGYRGGGVLLERRTDGGWRTIQRDKQNADGAYRFHVRGWVERGTFKYRVVVPETAKHRRAASGVLRLDVVRVVTYQIETRGRIVASMDTFKSRVAEIYADRRGWSRAYVRFQRLKRGADFSVVLSQARYVSTFAPICDRYYSCRVGRYVIINQDRWRFGTPYFKQSGGTLSEYRAMVVDHETGHWFGLGHASCSKRGAPAPVMMQQSKGLYGCKPNAWPLPGEIARVR